MKRLFVIAAIATLATAAQAEEASNNTAATTTVAASTAADAGPTAATVGTTANQSTTAIQDPEAAATAGKSWSVTLMNQTAVDAGQLNYKDNDKKSFSAINYAGFGYKLDPKSRVGLRQYFTVDHDGATEANKTTVNDAVLTYSRSGLAGVLGSDALAPTFWYYAPTSDLSRSVNSNGQVRLDLEIAWTLTPKWAVSYYLNPRQNFIPTGEIADGKGGMNPVFAKTTLIHYGYLYYSVNDNISAYTYGGYLHRWRTSTATLTDQDVNLGLGASFTFMGGKVNLNPEISVGSHQVASAQKVAAEQIVQENNVSYVLTSAIVF